MEPRVRLHQESKKTAVRQEAIPDMEDSPPVSDSDVSMWVRIMQSLCLSGLCSVSYPMPDWQVVTHAVSLVFLLGAGVSTYCSREKHCTPSGPLQQHVKGHDGPAPRPPL